MSVGNIQEIRTCAYIEIYLEIYPITCVSVCALKSFFKIQSHMHHI